MAVRAKSYVLLGMFCSLVLVGIMAVVGVVVGRSNPLEAKHTLYVEFIDLKGIRPGTPVSVQGHIVGAVSRIEVEERPEGPPVLVAVLKFSADDRYTIWIREDSKFVIVNQNLFGDKRIDISFGSPESGRLADGARIPASPSASVQDVLDQITGAAVTLNSTIRALSEKGEVANINLGRIFKNIEITTEHLAEISETVSLALGGDEPELREKIARDFQKAVAAVGSLGNRLQEAAEQLDPSMLDKLQLLALVQNFNRMLIRLNHMLDPDRGAVPAAQAYDDFAVTMKNMREVSEDLKEVIATLKKRLPEPAPPNDDGGR